METDAKNKRRHHSLPELYDTKRHKSEMDAEEMQKLTEMLQDAILNNPHLEQCLNTLDLF